MVLKYIKSSAQCKVFPLNCKINVTINDWSGKFLLFVKEIDSLDLNARTKALNVSRIKNPRGFYRNC